MTKLGLHTKTRAHRNGGGANHTFTLAGVTAKVIEWRDDCLYPDRPYGLRWMMEPIQEFATSEERGAALDTRLDAWTKSVESYNSNGGTS